MDKSLKIFLIVTGLIGATGIILLLRSRKRPLTQQDLLSRKSQWVKNDKTRSEVMRLHPAVRRNVADFFDDIERYSGYVPIVTSGYRDSGKQAQLYAQNPKNAKPGYSMHEYGFAVDINLTKDGRVVIHKQSPVSAWKNAGIVDLAQKRGFKWGGLFAGYYDPVHFYIEPMGMKSSDLLALAKQGKKDESGYIKTNIV